VRIPITVRPSGQPRWASYVEPAPVAEAVPPVTDGETAVPPEPVRTTDHAPRDTQALDEESLDAWRDRALRLQAEIENFRKRQQRLAEERILADRERLLRAFLDVADNLERALDADTASVGSLRQGVDLTHQTLTRILSQEGVEPIQSVGQPFDPAWYEAVDTVPHQQVGVEPGTIVQVEQEGYRLGDRLLRPARVIVAT
jgi:molecular chaperone GrpE